MSMNQSNINSYLFGSNSAFIEELYARYAENPNSVDPEWRQFFAGLGDDLALVKNTVQGTSWAPRKLRVIGGKEEETKKPQTSPQGKSSQDSAGSDSIRALMLIRGYRERGHTIADIDPLRLTPEEVHPELDPRSYGFGPEDFDRPIYLGGHLGLEKASLREILAVLRQIYCSSIGFEYSYISHPEQKAWLRERIELSQARPALSVQEKRAVFETLTEVESFEQFLHVKFTGTKRFSIEGADSMIPALKTVIQTAAESGVEYIVIGMPHRGRLNVMTAVMGKPYAAMLSEFHGNAAIPNYIESSGDVKYHLGTSHDIEFPGGKKVHLSLTANPSHLEAVNSVVTGKVRARQDQVSDASRSLSMGILLHGDAAFAGQGSIAENFALSDLDGYRTGGTVHIIVNNQIGFTTSPKKGRSSPYPSDVAKMVEAPIFHVNGDDPEAVVFVSKLATEFRQRFKKDVVIDVVCYRRHGHNETDEPMFTQPAMYTKINAQPTTRTIYARKLVAEGSITEHDVEKKSREFREFLDSEFESGKSYKPNKADWLEGNWKGMEQPKKGADLNPPTGVDLALLKELGHALARVPESHSTNRKILSQLEAKKKMVDSGTGLDWAAGEALGFASLLAEGKAVRLSGQDSGRGTFSHRHSVLIDQKTEDAYLPLNNLRPGQARYEVIDSALSEFAVLGFEYGYSLADPNCLTIWEAQFGDFSNGAQVIIDQFITSGEAKWLRMSGLVMLLPHGYEGQGPEHSSARLERFLQLSAEDNIQVANITTPANYFHALRRQLARNFRKPLIVMSPKSVLRHKLATSQLAEMGPGTRFKPVIGETAQLDDNAVKRVVISSGKVYYDLLEKREKDGIKDAALVRLEQLYPFPAAELGRELARYKNAEVIWCQEEPRNMGGWFFVDPLIEELLSHLDGKAKRAVYAGRKEAASPATGFYKTHNKEQAELVAKALGI